MVEYYYEHEYYVYILTRERNSVFYVGVTQNLLRRVFEHKNKLRPCFTNRYNVTRLVYYEMHWDIYQAIHREKIIKKYSRKKKFSLIESVNPEWKDLYNELSF